MRTVRLLSVIAGLTGCVCAQKFEVTIPCVRDTTLYEDSLGLLGNGAGSSFFIGANAFGEARRTLIAFDIVGSLPAGARVIDCELQLTVAQTSAFTPTAVTVHRMLRNWSEGTNAASGNGGSGSIAQAGDATWLYANYPTTPWTTPGGDYDPVPQAAVQMPLSGIFAFGTTPGMIADLQGWLDGWQPNSGWLIKVADETVPQTARRLHSRESLLPGVQPQLRISYVPAGGSLSVGVGCVSSNGQPLLQTWTGSVTPGSIVNFGIGQGLSTGIAITFLSYQLLATPQEVYPGCRAYALYAPIPYIGPLLLSRAGAVNFSFGMPATGALFGYPLALQSFMFDNQVPAGFVLSNAHLIVFG